LSGPAAARLIKWKHESACTSRARGLLKTGECCYCWYSWPDLPVSRLPVRRRGVRDSSFTGNAGEYGGALEATADLLTLTGDTFTGNHATADGGAIAAYRAANLTKTVVFGNSAVDEGGGICLNMATVNLGYGTIVTGNAPDNCYGFSC
jgi:hypothetical protein